MAIIPEIKYAGKITPASAAYPYGEARNITTPGDGTGTPWEAALVNDLFGWQQALLSLSGITPSGNPDMVGASQYLAALFTLLAPRIPDYATLQTTDPTLIPWCILQELHIGAPGSSGFFEWGATVDKATANGGTIVDPGQTLANQGTGVGLGCWVRVYSGAANRSWFADETAWNNFQLSTVTTGNKRYGSTKGDTAGVSDEANFAGQGTTPAPIGWIKHHYTDGNLEQIDNVGDGNTILVIKNANNPTRRPDKVSNFVGTGVFLALLEHNLSGPSSHNMFNIDRNAVLTWTGDNPRTTTAKLQNTKADDSFWAFQFVLTYPHASSFDFAGIFQLGRDLSLTRTTVLFPLANGVLIKAINQMTFDISGTALMALIPAGHLNMIGGGAFGYASNSTGSVTQLTSKSTGVTLNKPSGKITMNNAALAAGASVEFTLSNTTISINDVLNVVVAGIAGYAASVSYVANNAAVIKLTNTTAGSLSDAVNLNFAVTKITL